MDALEKFKMIFEPKLLEEFEEKATEVEIKAGETILDYVDNHSDHNDLMNLNPIE